MKKKIFDALILAKTNTGVGRGILQIIEKLKGKKDYLILINRYFPLKKNDYNILYLPYSHLFFVRFIYQIFLIPFIMIFFNANTYVSPTSILPLFKYGNYKVIVHDLMLYKVQKKYSFFKSFLYHFYYFLVFLNGDEFITPSESTKRDLSVHVKKKIIVRPWQIGRFPEKEMLLPYLIDKKFILTVGSLERGKNIPFLISAYSKLKNEIKDKYYLTLTGKNISENKKIMKLIKKLDLEKNIIFTGFVSDNELVWLYKNTSLFVFPSKYEGFGFPVLEAIYFGAPTICSDTSSLKEILTDRTFRFSLKAPENCTKLMTKMFTDDTYKNLWQIYIKNYHNEL